MDTGRDFQQLYAQMFAAQQHGRSAEAEMLKNEIERMRVARTERPSLPNLSNLPDFVRRKAGFSDFGNCINAAFNFHFVPERDHAFSTMEFLAGIRHWFDQIDGEMPAQIGDLVVFWSRTGGSWDRRRIDVQAMRPSDLDFPYGLVFDHVAVRISDEVAFHKPDSTAESVYRFDYLEAVSLPTRSNRGFEMTFHRRKNYVCAGL